MAVRVDIISIGTLSRNRLWNEPAPSRTPHATTTLLRPQEGTNPRRILVDPGLPPQVQAARLNERAGLKTEQIDTIFLTCFRPAHRAGLAAFPKAKIFLHQAERDAVEEHLEALLDRGGEDAQVRQVVQLELDLLRRTEPAPDQLAPQVDIFPLPGYTPGTCGLLVTDAASTTLIAGDAIPTRDHLLAGQVLPDSFDLAGAQESLQEAYEIADLIVPGHDNIFQNPRSFGG